MMTYRFAALFLGLVISAVIKATEHEHTHAINVTDAWARATFAMANTAAVYVSVRNAGEVPVNLVGISVDKRLAKHASLHDTRHEEGMAKMRLVALPLAIAPGESLVMGPGGKHIMLMGLNSPLDDGQGFTLTLRFGDGTALPVGIKVRAGGEGHHHHH